MTSPQEAVLLLGPVLRHVDETTATVWVETSGVAEVRVLHGRADTFEVEGHHFALVVVDGLQPGAETEYAVEVNGVRAWPEAGDARPAPRIRTLSSHRDVELVFGSCRDDRPDLESRSRFEAGADALVTLSAALQTGERPLPDLMLLLGDQIYPDYRRPPTADNPAADQRRNDARDVRTFEEYAAVYRRSWSQADIRWLFATVPSAMMFDDHEVRDNWNVSAAWRREASASPHWREQVTSACMAYWLYQHCGNLSPRALHEEGVWPALTASPVRGAPLREFAEQVDGDVDGGRRSRWSYERVLGRSRLVVLDTRSVRVLASGERSMFSDPEWAVVEGWVRGDCDHLLVASSVPVLLHHSQHDGEAWNEALSERARWDWVRRSSEHLRRAGNLDQWASFQTSFRRMLLLLGDVAAGRRGVAPKTILLLSGDVHHAYLAPMAFPDALGARSRVVQVVCSPFRNELSARVRGWLRVAGRRPARLIMRLLARSVGALPAPAEWEVTAGPMFGNFVATVTVAPDEARVRIDRTATRDGRPVLLPAHEETFGH